VGRASLLYVTGKETDSRSVIQRDFGNCDLLAIQGLADKFLILFGILRTGVVDGFGEFLDDDIDVRRGKSGKWSASSMPTGH